MRTTLITTWRIRSTKGLMIAILTVISTTPTHRQQWIPISTLQLCQLMDSTMRIRMRVEEQDQSTDRDQAQGSTRLPWWTFLPIASKSALVTAVSSCFVQDASCNSWWLTCSAPWTWIASTISSTTSRAFVLSCIQVNHGVNHKEIGGHTMACH